MEGALTELLNWKAETIARDQRPQAPPAQAPPLPLAQAPPPPVAPGQGITDEFLTSLRLHTESPKEVARQLAAALFTEDELVAMCVTGN